MEQKTREKLEQIILLAQACLGDSAKTVSSHVTKKASREPDAAGSATDVLGIANMIGTCEESEVIQKKVLDTDNNEAKVLMCLYVSHKYFSNSWLQTGDIVRITLHIGVKVETSTASKILKRLQPYLESSSMRKNGLPTPYRLNRKGVKYFETILYGNDS